MPTSVRLDPKTEKLLRRLMRATGKTRSDLIRDAVARYVDPGSLTSDATTAYQALSPWIGIAHGGPPDLSVDTGRKYTEALRTKHAKAKRERRQRTR